MNVLSIVGAVLICIEFIGAFIVPYEQVKYIGLWPVVICMVAEHIDFGGNITWILIWTALAVLVDIGFLEEEKQKGEKQNDN